MAKNTDETTQSSSGDESHVDSTAIEASADVQVASIKQSGYDQNTGAFNS